MYKRKPSLETHAYARYIVTDPRNGPPFPYVCASCLQVQNLGSEAATDAAIDALHKKVRPLPHQSQIHIDR